MWGMAAALVARGVTGITQAARHPKKTYGVQVAVAALADIPVLAVLGLVAALGLPDQAAAQVLVAVANLVNILRPAGL